MENIFTKLIGTLAVVLIVAAFIGGSDTLSRFFKTDKKWKYSVLFGIIGGLFGVYGNISGFNLNGAVISVRDIGPMLAGFVSGPLGGVIAGIIAGLHRLFLGGITANACVVATCCIGLISGLLSLKWRELIKKPYVAFIFGAFFEVFHLSIVLIMVKPYETAVDIVKQIALPFILINAVGFALMVTIITYTEKQRGLVVEKGRLQSELDIAKTIQENSIPNIFPAFPEREEFDIYASMTPAKEVGGDFYNFFLIDDDHIAMVIADVSGKGIPAALFMMVTNILISDRTRMGGTPAEILTFVNNNLCEHNKADMFVTAWLGILEISTGKLTAANAGHDDPAVYRKNGKFEIVKNKHGLVIGAMAGVKYRDFEIQLNEGDKLFLFTDGVPEATDKDNNMFGFERMLSSLNNSSDKNPKGVLDGINEAVASFVGDAPQFDDLTMMCIELKERNKMKTLTVEATNENLTAVNDFIDGFLEENGCPPKAQMQIDLSVEEIYVNIANYAYGEGTGKAEISVDNSNGEVTVIFKDSGVPYNPLEKEDPDISLSADEREIGGLGIFLTKKNMDFVSYEYVDGKNVFTMKKNIL
ncbi:MAG: serine/threonine protein phosphatase [Ruminococcaceae bacterium]|jgi:sigma-B regulation protein RsbU (phosphoserine phosphatase)|nr:serine/threonine protein phosphatase [Oscillospiraceae bacterium]